MQILQGEQEVVRGVASARLSVSHVVLRVILVIEVVTTIEVVALDSASQAREVLIAALGRCKSALQLGDLVPEGCRPRDTQG